MTTDPSARQFLRHTLATVAYRAAKAVRGAPPHFADFRSGPTTRRPVEILAHMGDLFDWALTMARGAHAWHDSGPRPWETEVERFFGALRAFDDYLTSPEPLGTDVETLFQGPVADALQHTGQLTMLRRMADAPILGENYAKARIAAGQVGQEQPVPLREFP